MNLLRSNRSDLLTCTALLLMCGSAIGQQLPSLQQQQQQEQQQQQQEEQQQRDVLTEAFFPPEFVLQHAGDVALREDQRQAIEMEVQTIQTELPKQQEQLQAEMDSLSQQLQGDTSNEAAILAQLDKVLDMERQIKRMHLTMLLRVRNQLSAAQRDKLQTIREEVIAGQQEVQQRIARKINRIQQVAQQLTQQGQPPTQLRQLMQTFQQRMQRGDVQGAEEILDQALASMGESQ